jgi:RNA polymerase sigma factor (sigma-70 family)
MRNGDQNDEQLMLAYQLGDEGAFLELYRRHAGLVSGFLRGKLREEAMVNDVFQNTFLKLHKSRDRYRASLPFLPWLFTICRNEMIDAFRKKARTKETPVEILPEFAIVEDEEKLEPPDVTVLPPKQRQIIELRFQSELSFEEIALRLGTNPINARQLLSRAIKALKGFHDGK